MWRFPRALCCVWMSSSSALFRDQLSAGSAPSVWLMNLIILLGGEVNPSIDQWEINHYLQRMMIDSWSTGVFTVTVTAEPQLLLTTPTDKWGLNVNTCHFPQSLVFFWTVNEVIIKVLIWNTALEFCWLNLMFLLHVNAVILCFCTYSRNESMRSGLERMICDQFCVLYLSLFIKYFIFKIKKTVVGTWPY